MDKFVLVKIYIQLAVLQSSPKVWSCYLSCRLGLMQTTHVLNLISGNKSNDTYWEVYKILIPSSLLGKKDYGDL